MKRVSKFALLVGVTLLSSVAQAQSGVTNTTITASATIDAILEFDVNDSVIECGTVAVGQADPCPDSGTANIDVRANSDWDLTLDDFGGAGEDVVTLFVDDFAKMGQFLMDLTTDAPEPGNGGTAGPQVNVVITGAIRLTGTDEQIIDTIDDFGPYLGEFDLTIAVAN